MKSGKKDMKKYSVKKKSLFDHIKQITAVQSPNYWEEISDEDKKTWSNYMVHRFLSMKMEWVELVNELQKYNLESKDLYKLYANVLPKGKQWLKYIKGEKRMEHPQWLINLVSLHMKNSRKEAYDAVEMYMLTEGGMLELAELCKKYGVEPKKIEKAGLNVLGSVGGYTAGNG
jgi:Ni,Fe-hydrogenase III component G|tara:strand:- start:2334 stop:2852 length:519 start_codon:yes stop_codon:yes gene_type:complete